MLGIRALDVGVELGKGGHPAVFVIVACGGVGELLVQEGKFGAFPRRSQLDGDLRLELGHALAGPGEHEPAVRHDLLIDTGRLVV